ncbi:MAG: hypothetical protein Q9228_004693 [Teloschistes exilis]
MAGAGKKRAKENRQAEQKSQHVHPAGNDGPSDRPGSSSGPPANPESSRGRAPSNAPSNPPSNAPSQSARGGSRPPSASGPPLRDPAREQPLPPRAELNKRIEWGGNAFDFYASESATDIDLCCIPSKSSQASLLKAQLLIIPSVGLPELVN